MLPSFSPRILGIFKGALIIKKFFEIRSVCRDFERKTFKNSKSVENDPFITQYRLFSTICKGPLVAEYGVENDFESKPVYHSCLGLFPASLKEKYKKKRRLVELVELVKDIYHVSNINSHKRS